MQQGTRDSSTAAITIWTIGHSTRGAEEFQDMLRSRSIEVLVDVRTFPGSRRHPHFNKENLASMLPSIGVQYIHLLELGGRRTPRQDSRNTAWNNASFRGYADHMESSEFERGVNNLLQVAREKRAAVMCAEALWWRCHRGLISDFLKSHGINVIHIIDAKKTEEHPYTPAARIVEGKLSYEGLLTG